MSPEQLKETINGSFRIGNFKLSTSFVIWFIAVIFALGSGYFGLYDNMRRTLKLEELSTFNSNKIVGLETNYSNIEKRLDRIDFKIDRLLSK